jgi:hypothetical protein
MRNSETYPENPSEFIQDYFGHFRDPSWDEVDRMKLEIESLTLSIESKTKEIITLHQEITRYKKISHIKETFAILDPDNNGFLSIKALVQRLSGQPRFEMDYKLTQANFLIFILDHLTFSENEEERNLYWNGCYLPFRDLVALNEDGKPKPPPFAGRIEDSFYQRILEKFRTFTPR